MGTELTFYVSPAWIKEKILLVYNLHQFYSLKELINYLNHETPEILSKIPADIWTQLINLLGEKIIKPNILSNGTTLSRQYTNVDYLKNMGPRLIINERENILVAFLEGISGRIFKDESSDVAYQIACVIESIYYLVNFNWIFPHWFVTNLIQSTISGSKTVTTLNGSFSSGG